MTNQALDIHEIAVMASMARRNPGIQAANLAKQMDVDMPTRTALAALRRLEKRGMVHSNYRAATGETRWTLEDKGRHTLDRLGVRST